jgi:hypothetical protein
MLGDTVLLVNEDEGKFGNEEFHDSYSLSNVVM